ncbi:RraA family protein [Roseateles sp. UC29_93]|uniref:RraA family protein n=1 Tax=Roseateles sp. UC29_93 TaxID=3350177 RepID=UPI003671AA7B
MSQAAALPNARQNATPNATPDALPDVIRDIERTPAEVVARAAAYPSSILADVAGRRGALHGRIQGLSPSMRFAGTALTVEVRPGDNLMIHAAMALAQPGDVLVVDGKGDLSSALMGEIMSQQCVALGIAAVVIDGAVRDSEAIRALGFPMFAAGLNPNGPTKSVSGRLNHPVSIGGVTVHPGDLVVGDADGVTVVERARAASLLPLAEAKVAAETARIAGIRDRVALRPVWLDGALRAAGVIKDGETL